MALILLSKVIIAIFTICVVLMCVSPPNIRADVLAPSMVLWGSGPLEGGEVMSVEPS